MSDKSVKIRLNKKDIVFRRCHREGQKQIVQGDVSFYTESPTTIKSVKVILKGVRKVSWFTDTLQPQHVEQKECILYQEQTLHAFNKNAAQASRAGPGLYSWSFAFRFGGDLPESVDWLPYDSNIAYTVTAEVATGIFWMATSTTEHLQFIKSPSFWADDLYFAPEFHELALPSGLICQVSLGQPYQPADGQLDLAFSLTGNQDGVESIALELLQVVQLAVTKGGRPWSATKHERCITSSTKNPNQFRAENHHPATRFSIPLQLPLPPYTCVQSVEDERVKVRYKLRAKVCVRDAEDKTCEHPIDFSPKLFAPIRTRPKTTLVPGGMGPDCYAGCLFDSSIALPPYGEHVFDALYEGDVCLSADDSFV